MRSERTWIVLCQRCGDRIPVGRQVGFAEGVTGLFEIKKDEDDEVSGV